MSATEPAKGMPIRKVLSIFFLRAARPRITPSACAAATPGGVKSATGWGIGEIATVQAPFL